VTQLDPTQARTGHRPSPRPRPRVAPVRPELAPIELAPPEPAYQPMRDTAVEYAVTDWSSPLPVPQYLGELYAAQPYPYEPVWPSPAAGPPPLAPPPYTGPQLAPPPRSRRTLVAVIAAAIVVAAGVVVAVLISRGGGNAPQGYNADLGSLENSVQTTTTENLSNDGSDVVVTSVDCIQKQGREYICHLEMSDGDQANIGVTVAPDGQSWVSHAAN